MTFVNQTMADAGHTLISAGAFVFDDDVMAGTQIDKDGVQLQVTYFNILPVLIVTEAFLFLFTSDL